MHEDFKLGHYQAKAGSRRQTLLGRSSPVLGPMEKGTLYCPTGHRRALASIRVQTVLGHALQSAKTSGRWPQDLPADP